MSGSFSISVHTLEKVRATLRTVSRTGHSQAESMWAWPVASTVRADAPAGDSSTGRSTSRAMRAVPGMSSGSAASRAASSARRISWRRWLFSGRETINPRRARTSSASSQICTSRRASWSSLIRYRSSSGMVSGSPSGVGEKLQSPETMGFAAHSR